MNIINFIQMKKIKTLLFASLLFFVTGNAIAQQATRADFIATWSGTGSDGNSYTLILNADNTASLNDGSSNYTNVVWKLKNNDVGNIVYDKNNHAVMLLIANVASSGSSSVAGQSLTLQQHSNGSVSKTYYADVFCDVSLKTLTMIVNFKDTSSDASGKNPITINFTK